MADLYCHLKLCCRKTDFTMKYVKVLNLFTYNKRTIYFLRLPLPFGADVDLNLKTLFLRVHILKLTDDILTMYAFYWLILYKQNI